MKKQFIYMSFSVISYASQTILTPMQIKATPNSVIINDIRANEQKSADLAESLYKQSASINMVRRSGIANDIVLRGQKRDNINVLIDDAKIYGACINRMDPTTSHVITTAVESVEVKEGPFDVEQTGSLSGMVSIKTQDPTEELDGTVGTNYGSFGYWKLYANTSVGTDSIRFLLSASKEQSNQYKDASGNTFAQQLVEQNAPIKNQYATKNSDLLSFEKLMFLSKMIWDIDDKQVFKASYMLNRSDKVLYPSSPMDAVYDNSDIATAKYTIKALGYLSDRVSLDIAYSAVNHPMSTQYRNSGATIYKTNHLSTSVLSFTLKNHLHFGSAKLLVGIQNSMRSWDGNLTATNVKNARVTLKVNSLPNVVTNNSALYAKLEQTLGATILESGMRYDYNRITATDKTTRYFTAISGNIVAKYDVSNSFQMYAGVGHSVRVPDARELYNTSSMGVQLGTPTLKEVHNSEADVGGEWQLGDTLLKAKAFYSLLNDYIYYNNDKKMVGNAFENIDAYIFGGQSSAEIMLREELELDMGIAMQRGKKLEPLNGQSDIDLANITPIKVNASLKYDCMEDAFFKLNMVAADKWRWYDADNGEQALAGYVVFNTKYKQTYSKNYELTLGIDNLFNQSYAVSNTYYDLTLITAGTTNKVMLLNEPGRYFYINVAYKF